MALELDLAGARAAGISPDQLWEALQQRPEFQTELRNAQAAGISADQLHAHLVAGFAQLSSAGPAAGINTPAARVRRTQLGLPAIMSPGQGRLVAQQTTLRPPEDIGILNALSQGAAAATAGLPPQPEALQHPLALATGGVLSGLAQVVAPGVVSGFAAKGASMLPAALGREALVNALAQAPARTLPQAALESGLANAGINLAVQGMEQIANRQLDVPALAKSTGGGFVLGGLLGGAFRGIPMLAQWLANRRPAALDAQAREVFARSLVSPLALPPGRESLPGQVQGPTFEPIPMPSGLPIDFRTALNEPFARPYVGRIPEGPNMDLNAILEPPYMQGRVQPTPPVEPVYASLGRPTLPPQAPPPAYITRETPFVPPEPGAIGSRPPSASQQASAQSKSGVSGGVSGESARQAADSADLRSPERAIPVLDDQIQQAANKFSQYTDQLDALQFTGTFEKAARPSLAKGSAANPDTVISRQILIKTHQEAIRMGQEIDRLEAVVRATGDDVASTQLKMVRDEAATWFARVSEAHRSWHDVGMVMQEATPAFRELSQRLGAIPQVKAGLPLYDRLIDQLQHRQWGEAAKTAVNAFRLTLFPLASGLRDFVSNTISASMKLPAYLAEDLFEVGATRTLPRIAGLMRAIREQTTAKLATDNAIGLPAPVSQAIRGYIAGQEIATANPSGPVFTNATIKGRAVDPLLSAAIRLKQGADVALGETFALGELFAQGTRQAARQGLTGKAREDAILHYVQAPPPEGVNAAISAGNAVRYNRPLSALEERVSDSTAVKLLFDVFPRWGFQFARWTAETLGVNPTIWRQARAGTLSPQAAVGYLATMATGWGGVRLLNDLWYDRIDPQSMELVKPDGNRIRLSGLSPIPDAYLLAALIKGDFARAQVAAQYSSLPILKNLSSQQPSAGILGPMMKSISYGYAGKTGQERVGGEIVKLVNSAIPGQSLLSAIRVAMDPTVRTGLGENLPGVSFLAQAKIDPTTGEALAPQQDVLGLPLPTIKGLTIPGASRIVSPVQRLLLEHGFGTRKPRVTTLLEFPADDVPALYRELYERLAGQEVNRLVGPQGENPFFQTLPFTRRRELLGNLLSNARAMARAQVNALYPHAIPPEAIPAAVQALPPELVR